jgi:hypothetical protein
MLQKETKSMELEGGAPVRSKLVPDNEINEKAHTFRFLGSYVCCYGEADAN